MPRRPAERLKALDSSSAALWASAGVCYSPRLLARKLEPASTSSAYEGTKALSSRCSSFPPASKS